jgi:CubicO group peptidase (beta-lactamase class C family)
VNTQKFYRLFLTLLCLILTLTLAIGTVNASPSQHTETDFEAIDAYVTEQMSTLNFPGLALGIVQNNQPAHLKGFGIADSSGRPITPQTPFRIGSVTKSFTALAIMQLVEEGKINLDAPVQTYLPWFRLADEEASAKITVRHLLNHTSGISMKDGNSLFASKTGLEETVRSLDKIKLTQAIGSTYQYCNINYMIAGLIVEVVSGQAYADYVSEHIFEPLDMQHSYGSLETARLDSIAHGHIFMLGRFWENDGWVPPANVPAGALIVSIEDMTHYALMQMNAGRYEESTLLSPQGMDELHAPAVLVNENEFYAMGWTVGKMEGTPYISHTGDDGRFHSVIFLLHEEGLGIVLLVNATGFIQSAQIDQIAIGVLNMLNDQPAQPAATPFLVVFIYWITLLTPLLMLLGIPFIWRKFDRINVWGTVIIVAVYLGLVIMLFQLALQTITLTSMLVFYPDIGYALVATAAIGIGWSVIFTVLFLIRQRAKLVQ